MQCPCGSMCNDVDYEVKTLKMAIQWDLSVTESDLPVNIYGHRCQSCGRQLINIIKSNAKPEQQQNLFN